MPERVTICEMAPRDGMQVVNRTARISFAMRLELLRALQRAGFPYIEAGSFVSPKLLPQLADTVQLLTEGKLPEYTGQLAALVPNIKYYEKFGDTPNLAAVAVFLSASEEYSRKNKNIGIEDDLIDARNVAAKAQSRGHRLRAHLSGAFRDLTSDNKRTDHELVVRMCRELINCGCEVVALADTDGRATPHDVARTLAHVGSRVGLMKIGVHLHNRSGFAIANAWEAYRLGIRTFDGAVGGIGGAKALASSVGNIATEELVLFFEQLGGGKEIETNIDSRALRDALTIVHKMTKLVGDPRPTSKLMDEILSGTADEPG